MVTVQNLHLDSHMMVTTNETLETGIWNFRERS